MSPKLAFFDLDNTLIDRAELFRGWASDFLRRHGRDADEVAWLVEQDGEGLTSRDVLFDAVRDRYGIAVTNPDLVAGYYADYPLFVVPPPSDTLAALRMLRDRGWRLAIVTNGPPPQEHVIDRTGLRHMVDVVCVSATVALRKPDPSIFQLAADQCGMPLAGAWMIGDSATHDIGGAAAAGINSVWIDRGRAWVEAGYRPTLIAGTVGEAVRLLLAAEGDVG